MTLQIVPQFVVDGLESAATRDPQAMAVWLSFVRWKAHTVNSPALLDNPCDLIDRARGQLAMAAKLLSGDIAMIGVVDEEDALVSVEAGKIGRDAEAEEMARGTYASRRTQVTPGR